MSIFYNSTWYLVFVLCINTWYFLSYLALLIITLTAELQPTQEGKGSMFVYLCLVSSLCVSLFGRNGLCLWRAHVSLFVVDTYTCLESIFKYYKLHMCPWLVGMDTYMIIFH